MNIYLCKLFLYKYIYIYKCAKKFVLLKYFNYKLLLLLCLKKFYFNYDTCAPIQDL